MLKTMPVYYWHKQYIDRLAEIEFGFQLQVCTSWPFHLNTAPQTRFTNRIYQFYDIERIKELILSMLYNWKEITLFFQLR